VTQVKSLTRKANIPSAVALSTLLPQKQLLQLAAADVFYFHPTSPASLPLVVTPLPAATVFYFRSLPHTTFLSFTLRNIMPRVLRSIPCCYQPNSWRP